MYKFKHNGFIFEVGKDSVIRFKSGSKLSPENLYNLIMTSPNVEMVPKFTKEEVKLAKELKDMFPDTECLSRRDDRTLKLYDGSHDYFEMRSDLFPSLEAGESYDLEKVIEMGETEC